MAYRQTLRNLERCVTWEGIIPRKRRKQFNQFLKHEDPRIRQAAVQMQKEGAASRVYHSELRKMAEPGWEAGADPLPKAFYPKDRLHDRIF